VALHCGGVVSCISSPIPHADCLVWIRRDGFGRLVWSYLDVYKDTQLQMCSEGDKIYQPKLNHLLVQKSTSPRMRQQESSHMKIACSDELARPLFRLGNAEFRVGKSFRTRPTKPATVSLVRSLPLTGTTFNLVALLSYCALLG
jgi:hypothetical protein